MTELELYWIAGILEGEGSFMHGPPSKPNLPLITLQMTDEDVVQRVATILNCSYRKSNSERYAKNNWKSVYILSIKGSKAVKIMSELLPLMGERRQARIREIIQNYKPTTYKIKPEDYKEILTLVEKRIPHRIIAEKYGVERSYMTKIILKLRKVGELNSTCPF